MRRGLGEFKFAQSEGLLVLRRREKGRGIQKLGNRSVKGGAESRKRNENTAGKGGRAIGEACESGRETNHIA